MIRFRFLFSFFPYFYSLFCLNSTSSLLFIYPIETANLLGINNDECNRPETAQILSGNINGVLPSDIKPFAHCYGGFQFGVWAQQLGDGRAISLGQIVVDETK